MVHGDAALYNRTCSNIQFYTFKPAISRNLAGSGKYSPICMRTSINLTVQNFAYNNEKTKILTHYSSR